MKIFDSKPFMDKGGWFVGNFEPTVFKTTLFEVSYKLHHKGEDWPKHHHKISTEINFLIRGTMTINNILLEAGKIFIIEKNESVKPCFLEDCELIVIKTPSVTNDKYNDI
jgi:quercetin dioxygenase-like cupin family protein